MMKRRMAALLALLLAGMLILSGCDLTADLPALKTARETAVSETAVPENADESPAEYMTEMPQEDPTEKPTKAPKKKKSEKATKKPTKAPTAVPTEKPAEVREEKTGPIIDPQEIADYLFTYGRLPDNFITKEEAKTLGWDSSRNYISDVAPGKSIGGDRFGNYDGKLPRVKGRKYYECDCYYRKGKRRAERIVYSNDGHVWYTEDHYETFTELFPSE